MYAIRSYYVNKSNKLLEGKLTDVKRQFRSNTFQVGILTHDIEGLMYQLTQKFTVGQTDFKSLDNDLKLEVQLGDRKSNELFRITSYNVCYTKLLRYQNVIPRTHRNLLQLYS